MNDELKANDAVVVAIGRTAIGRARKGTLAGIRPDDLAAQTFRAVWDRVPGLLPEDIEDLYLGCAEPHDEHGQNIARRIAVMLGADRLPGSTVNRFCASSLQATRMAFHGIRSGEGDAYLVGGVECVSRYQPVGMAENPLFGDSHERAIAIVEAGDSWTDPRTSGLLPDVYLQMGYTAEFVARTTGTSRQEQDEYAAFSQQRAQRAVESGFHAQDIIPVTLPNGTVADTDDCPRQGTTAEGLAALNPAFLPEGTVTAGNACPLNDGASAAVVMSYAKARDLGLQPQARILSSGVSALSPELMGLGPVASSRLALSRAGLSAADMDIVELNEAFAAQVLPSARELGVDLQKLNPYGGAIALGHPFGSTGVRMLTTLIHGLREQDGRFGLATMCVGGGQGMAMVVERL